jgi:cytoskeletal protein CcmA (bactofilin family)
MGYGQATGYGQARRQRIKGTVGGTITGRRIVVDKNGFVRGELGGEEVVIHGEVVGTVKAHVIHLMKTAHVAGELLYERLTVDAGAQLEARCVPTPKAAG